LKGANPEGEALHRKKTSPSYTGDWLKQYRPPKAKPTVLFCIAVCYLRKTRGISGGCPDHELSQLRTAPHSQTLHSRSALEDPKLG